jgi:ubiquinone/menaquinone biosynthesis C-methylase UbiE
MSVLATSDPYVAFTRRFFARWSPLYDWFAKPIGFAYGAAVRLSDARAGRSILDLCTGTGEIALRCGRRGARVTAVDLTLAMLTRAERKTRLIRSPSPQGEGARLFAVRYAGMDARRLAFPDRSFDAVLLSFALHDMPRKVRVQVLREAARVSRETLVVLDYDVPRRAPWRRAVLAGLGLFETPFLADFAKQGARGALEEAGLEIRETLRPLPGLFVIHLVTFPAS